MKQHWQEGESKLAGLDGLARERLPERDLWAGIESRIQPARASTQRQRPLWAYALAASLSAAVLTGALLRMPPDAPQPESPVMTAQAEPDAEPSPAPGSRVKAPYSNRDGEPRPPAARSLHTLRSESLDNAPPLVAERAGASGLMRASLARGSRSHSQEALLRANLKLVSQAEREVRRALKQDPESEALQSLLEAAQGQRAQLTAMLLHEPD